LLRPRRGRPRVPGADRFRRSRFGNYAPAAERPARAGASQPAARRAGRRFGCADSCQDRAGLHDFGERVNVNHHPAVLNHYAIALVIEVECELRQHAHGAEAAPMVWGDAETMNRLAVVARWIASVLLP